MLYDTIELLSPTVTAKGIMSVKLTITTTFSMGLEALRCLCIANERKSKREAIYNEVKTSATRQKMLYCQICKHEELPLYLFSLHTQLTTSRATELDTHTSTRAATTASSYTVIRAC